MAGALRDRHGGIRGLLDLLDNEEYREAIEYDLIDKGLRLRDLGEPGFTWRDLYVITRKSPPASALARELYGEDAHWGLLEQLAAAMVDAQNLANWLQSKDGAKNRNRPKPIPRPGVKADKDINKFGKDAVPIDEMADFLGWSTELATPEPVVPVDKVTPPPAVMQMEHDMNIAGHEHDCTICKPPRKRDARGRFTKN